MARSTKPTRNATRRAHTYTLPRGWRLLEVVRTARDTWVALAYRIGDGQYAIVPFFGDSRRRGELIAFDPQFGEQSVPALERFLDGNYPEFDARHGLVGSDDADVPPHSAEPGGGFRGTAVPDVLRGKLPRQNYNDDT